MDLLERLRGVFPEQFFRLSSRTSGVVFAAEPKACDRSRVAMLGAFACGLGMCNQHTLILMSYRLCPGYCGAAPTTGDDGLSVWFSP